MLNRIWVFLVITALLVGFGRSHFLGGDTINTMADTLFSSAKTGFELTLGLASSLILWLGFFQIAEAAGVVRWLSKILTPILHRLMPDVPRGHPAFGSMGLNVGMSMLGLDNGALPSGLKAMEQLQNLNEGGDTASQAQQMFLVYMTTSVTLFPISILGFRVAAGAVHPADVFLPLLIASYVGLFAGLAYMAVTQKIKLLDPVLLLGAGAFVTILAGLAWCVSTIAVAVISPAVTLFGNVTLLLAVFAFVGIAWFKNVPVYDTFLDGAKKGFDMAVNLLPYVIGMFVLISLLRSSGSFTLLEQGCVWLCQAVGIDSRWVAGIPQGILNSFSGGGARALMLDTFKNSGVDSYAGHLSAIIQGSSDTTFYILAACAGAAKLKNLGSAVTGSIIADIASFATALICANYFFAAG
jgi:spore maturation protein SpmA